MVKALPDEIQACVAYGFLLVDTGATFGWAFTHLGACLLLLGKINMGYPVAEYMDTGISIGGFVNPIRQWDLTNGYVMVFRNGENEHEIDGDLYEAPSEAVDRLKIAIVLYENKWYR